MEITDKISTFQFFSLLYLARALTTVTYIPSYTEGIEASDMFINVLLRIALGLIVIIPVYLLYRRCGSKNVIDVIRERSQLAAKITAVVYASVFFYFTVSTIARLDVFAGTIIFPETNVNYLLIFIAAICCYGAYLGLQALGRSAVLSLLAVVPALVFVTAVLAKKNDFLNFSPILYNGITPVAKTALNSVGRTVEFSMIAVSLPKVTGNNKKGFIAWLVLNTLTTAVLFFVLAGVMGNFANTQLFPIHTLSSIAQFSLFERLDAIFTAMWILCAFLKISFLIYLSSSILQKEFGLENIKTPLIPIGIALTAINLFVAKSVNRFMILDNSIVKLVFTLTTTFVIPLVVLLITHNKEEKKCEKQQLSSQ